MFNELMVAAKGEVEKDRVDEKERVVVGEVSRERERESVSGVCVRDTCVDCRS